MLVLWVLWLWVPIGWVSYSLPSLDLLDHKWTKKNSRAQGADSVCTWYAHAACGMGVWRFGVWYGIRQCDVSGMYDGPAVCGVCRCCVTREDVWCGVCLGGTAEFAGVV